MGKSIWTGLVLACLMTLAVGGEIGIVTALTGSVSLQEGIEPGRDIKSFIKLRESDRLTLQDNTRLQIVYFANGLQETWQGAGVLDVGSASSKLLKGGSKVEVKTLPLILVKQLTKTPSPDRGKTGMIRLRSMHLEGALDALEKTYADLRQQVAVDDHSPELYLLASYFELREFDKLADKLGQLTQNSPQDAEIAKLSSLYSQAIVEAKAKSK